MNKNGEIINSIDRALDILILLYYEQRELGVTEIAKTLGLHKSTVHRTLSTLENKGFAQQNLENGKYWLGMKIYALGMLVGEKMPLKHIIRPYAKELFEKFHEVVNVSVLDKTSQKYPRTILILKEESPDQILRVNPIVGSSSESHYSAVGKCLLAFSPKKVLDRFQAQDLPIYTKNTISNWDDLLKELEDVRINGYAIDNEELEIGLTCVAAPIVDKENNVIAAMSISGPTSRIRSEKFESIVNEVKNTAWKISNLLK
ncbi:IclR family transcriptional regulator [Wukongibacter baidiensis]|uniref:IclR family transcriptional regulator n=1 Tax=Wukongibacter baidiensis TaxID=1723361 RepID=UPI003D7FEB45